MAFNPTEQQIYDFLRKFPQVYVSATEVSRSVGNRKWFNADRNWARPILRRLEMEGWLESNPFGEYRVKRRDEDTTSFRRALHIPGMSLANTTIISADDATESLPNSPQTHSQLRGDYGDTGTRAA